MSNPASRPRPADRLHLVQQRIRKACLQHGRDPADVRLLAVSKGHPAAALEALAAAGQTCFGESYVQEAMEKVRALAGTGIEWHFIGPLQSNKTAWVAENCDWVHSVDRLKIAERLSRQRPDGMAPLQICLQVNVSAEASKSGVAEADLPALAERVAALPRLRLRGLMAIPRATSDFQEQRAAFRRVREARDALAARGHELDTLSMGMSGDLEAAIAEGSTLVRVGTALFGPRIL